MIGLAALMINNVFPLFLIVMDNFLLIKNIKKLFSQIYINLEMILELLVVHNLFQTKKYQINALIKNATLWKTIKSFPLKFESRFHP